MRSHRHLWARLCASVVLIAVLKGLLPLVIRAQAPADTFQVEINYVDVDALVTDQQGRFVSDLTLGDFELFEDGKPQKINTFSLVDIPVQRPNRFIVGDRSVTPDVKSNREPFAGRLYVIVLDDLDVSVHRTSHVRKFAREFIEHRL